MHQETPIPTTPIPTTPIPTTSIPTKPAVTTEPHAPPPTRPNAPSPRADGQPVALDALLQERFGISSFRPWQREAIEALLGDARRVLVVAPTGGGKSLCYQVPAVALPGTALVLSPLISLMEDQVRALEARGIPATFFASTLPREEGSRRMSALRRGAYKIVYAAPERLAYEGFLAAIAESRLSLVAVDEAHCIVQWGHDFRPEYLRIGEALQRLAPPRVLACTATATLEAREEIIRRLGWRPAEGGGGEAQERGAPLPAPRVILRGFARPNLHLEVREVGGPKDAARFTGRALVEALGRARAPEGAGIVYAATRKGTEKLADALRGEGWRAEAYHAGLAPEVRARISGAFAERALHVVVATNAFGMGIDRADVRVVVHAQPPSSIEAYYQEVGRAGRDGAPASGVLLFSPADIALRRRMCQLGSDGGDAAPEDAARAWQLFRELLRYVDARSCRHDFILRYFGDEAESLGGCGHCDVCGALAARSVSDPDTVERDSDTVRRALAGVARAKGAAGMQLVASMLVGESNERLRRLGLDRLSTHGVLAGQNHAEAMTVLRVLMANGWIDLTDSEFPVPLITPAGWRVMRGEVPPRVQLPRDLPKRRVRAARAVMTTAATAAAAAAATAAATVTAATAATRAVTPAATLSTPVTSAAAQEEPETSTVTAAGAAADAPKKGRRLRDRTQGKARGEARKGKRGAGHDTEGTAEAPAGVRFVERVDDEGAPALEARDRALYEALRAHRAELSRARKVPPYVVAPDRTLQDIARIRPISDDDLGLARGMGPARISQYGAEILRIVRSFAGR
ncbi:RecQ family ATP-dependent DNA helicase [Chondromyces apiculatus]|uniref:ATP-dependent DNA helicase RecQ n=1 Tax=Chondromyces apiculatus DSM 436 TaxID=1192034 RepID=A0A017T6V9_9BACT|nr:ATP-dependent DNA helicase RecQ [Chondromyces apiculatus]EYF04321.1 ATP-dependent DNA helicase RecQ [Chondromyces apiculatus DSM 436]